MVEGVFLSKKIILTTLTKNGFCLLGPIFGPIFEYIFLIIQKFLVTKKNYLIMIKICMIITPVHNFWIKGNWTSTFPMSKSQNIINKKISQIPTNKHQQLRAYPEPWYIPWPKTVQFNAKSKKHQSFKLKIPQHKPVDRDMLSDQVWPRNYNNAY